MGRRLLARTVELERATKEVDWKKLPKVIGPSVQAALDRDWSDPVQKAAAVKSRVFELEDLKGWFATKLAQEANNPPLSEKTAMLRQLMDQDFEPDPGSVGEYFRAGIAPDRRVSVEDSEKRHGLKSKTKRFNGNKRHIAADLDSELILSGTNTPANRPEDEAAPCLADDIASQYLEVGALFIDRGYVNAALVDAIVGRSGEIVCRPWIARNKGVFPNAASKINMHDLTITCPAGGVERIEFGSVTEFDLRLATTASSVRGARPRRLARGAQSTSPPTNSSSDSASSSPRHAGQPACVSASTWSAGSRTSPAARPPRSLLRRAQEPPRPTTRLGRP